MATETLKTVRRTDERRVKLPEELAARVGLKLKDGSATMVELRIAMAEAVAKGDGESVSAYQALKGYMVGNNVEFTLDEIEAANKALAAKREAAKKPA